MSAIAWSGSNRLGWLLPGLGWALGGGSLPVVLGDAGQHRPPWRHREDAPREGVTAAVMSRRGGAGRAQVAPSDACPEPGDGGVSQSSAGPGAIDDGERHGGEGMDDIDPRRPSQALQGSG